jgi:hypothetical protein
MESQSTQEAELEFGMGGQSWARLQISVSVLALRNLIHEPWDVEDLFPDCNFKSDKPISAFFCGLFLAHMKLIHSKLRLLQAGPGVSVGRKR